MHSHDGHLIHRYLQGESNAFRFLLDRHKHKVHALAYAKLGSFEDAEDVTQDVFLIVHRKLHTLKRWESFSAWLYAITSNICKRSLEKRARHPHLFNAESQEPNALTQQSLDSYHDQKKREFVHDSLASLPEMHRQVLTLYYLAGMSSAQISQFLGIAPSAVDKRLSRARGKLKAEYLQAMRDTFETHRLPVGFTQHILELTRGKRLRPIPLQWLPWSISATGVALSLLLFWSQVVQQLPFGERTSAPIPESVISTQPGELPVEFWESHSAFFSYAPGERRGADGVHVTSQWQRHTGNAVLTLGNRQNWMSKHVEEPVVVFDGTQYHMWYTGHDYSNKTNYKIGYAVSPDGIQWSPHPEPVFVGSQKWDRQAVYAPSVLYFPEPFRVPWAEGNFHYRMWYSGLSSGGYQIGYAVSQDGIEWRTYKSPVVGMELHPTFVSFAPQVLYSPEGFDVHWPDAYPEAVTGSYRYMMWYTFSDRSADRQYQIGVAVSDGMASHYDDDAVKWLQYLVMDSRRNITPYAVLEPGSLDAWDDQHVMHPSVAYRSTGFSVSYPNEGIRFFRYLMWYSGWHGFGDDDWATHPSSIGLAISQDGIRWNKHPANPFLDVGSSGAWDDLRVHGSSILLDGAEHKMWYTGHDGSHRRIGLATMRNPSTGLDDM